MLYVYSIQHCCPAEKLHKLMPHITGKIGGGGGEFVKFDGLSVIL